jgi:hypothetical protein
MSEKCQEPTSHPFEMKEAANWGGLLAYIYYLVVAVSSP